MERFAVEAPSPGCGLGRCGDERSTPRPIDAFTWATPPGEYNFRNLAPGGDCAVLFPTGELWVGRCLEAEARALTIKLWGSGEVRRLRVRKGMRAGVLGPYDWAQRRLVMQRQRGGEPATTLTIRPRRKKVATA